MTGNTWVERTVQEGSPKGVTEQQEGGHLEEAA